eukprot:CAMPEP_0174840340 /NCGR_PEP_ID=MMETSP1114-20130205/8626_1 /TAXON_ID=312471 /ORGANISM="Neobodo designis, Strain CCAP 1951/1" /LENGTH=477 /DNA_ID=CAMNT_0016074485 /DNA_START=82 /DNA_END=1512 /DNA_ORIENTATION=+
MSMRQSNKTRSRLFGQDDRSVGGVHMIQQQFKDMHRKIDHARKHVDNEPPMASMFKRPHFSSFGVDYRERVKEKKLPHVHARVDSSEPATFYLIKNLYINRRVRSQYDSSPRRSSPTKGGAAGAGAADTAPPGIHVPDGRETYAQRPRPLSARVATTTPVAAGRTHTARVMSEAAVDASVRGYAESIATRLEDIAVHREQLRRRRILRAQAELAATAPAAAAADSSSDDMLRDAAQEALNSLRARAGVDTADRDEGPRHRPHPPASFHPEHTADAHGVIPEEPSFARGGGVDGLAAHARPHDDTPFHHGARMSDDAADEAALNGVLRPPGRPKSAGHQFPVPTPPARVTPTVPSPAHVRRTPPPGVDTAALQGVLRPGSASRPSPPPATPQQPKPAESAASEVAVSSAERYAALRFPSTTEPDAGADGAGAAPRPEPTAQEAVAAAASPKRTGPPGSVYSANDFVTTYDDDDAEFDR